MRSKKKLLIINGSQFGHSAGHYYYCLYLKSQFDIEFVCYDRGLNKISLEGVQINYVKFDRNKIKRTLSFIKTGISLKRKMKPDILLVVYFNFCFILAFFGFSCVKFLDIRTGSLAVNKIKRTFGNFIIFLQSLAFDKRIILSESLRAKLKIKKQNTLVLPLGSEIFYNGQHNYEKLHLLYVGVFDGRNIDQTISGLGIFLDKYPSLRETIRYTIIGFGSAAEELKLFEQVKNSGLGKVVKFEGRKSYTEFDSYFESANIGVSFVPVTPYYDLQPPTKTFEYVLSGLFTIATSTFENKRVINGLNGVLCEDNAQSFAEAIECCYLKRQMLKAAEIRATLADYEWSKLVKSQLIPFLSEK